MLVRIPYLNDYRLTRRDRPLLSTRFLEDETLSSREGLALRALRRQ